MFAILETMTGIFADPISLAVCQVCTSTVETFDEYWTKAIQTKKDFYKRFALNDSEMLYNTTENEIPSEDEEQEIEQDCKIELVSEAFEDQQDNQLTEEINNFSSQSCSKSFECDSCNFKSLLKFDLECHIETNHINALQRQPKMDLQKHFSKVNGKYICPLCPSRNSSKHMRQHFVVSLMIFFILA